MHSPDYKPRVATDADIQSGLVSVGTRLYVHDSGCDYGQKIVVVEDIIGSKVVFKNGHSHNIALFSIIDDSTGPAANTPQPPIIAKAVYSDGVEVTETHVTIEGKQWERGELRKKIAMYNEVLRRPVGNPLPPKTKTTKTTKVTKAKNKK